MLGLAEEEIILKTDFSPISNLLTTFDQEIYDV